MIVHFRPVLKSVAAAFVAAVTLSACSSGGSWWENKEEERPCPHVNVLSDAASITTFRPGPGRDLTDILNEGRIVNFTGACGYDTDSDTGEGTLNVELRLDLMIKRGPADATRKAPLQYFVSATNENRDILSKETFDIVAEFPGNRTQVKMDDQPVYLTLPIASGQTGADYLIFVGFQLTRDQLDYNRAHK